MKKQEEDVAAFGPDEWTGIGGEYVRDPQTGKRYPREVWEQMNHHSEIPSVVKGEK